MTARSLRFRPEATRSQELWASCLALLTRRPRLSAAFAVFLTIVVPLGLAVAGLGSVARLYFPFISVSLSGLLYFALPEVYTGFILYLILITPFIRRFVDFYAGWQDISPIMVTPYLALSFSATALARVAYIDAPVLRRALLVLIPVFIAFLIAVYEGRVLSSGFEFMQWVMPFIFGVHILAHRADAAKHERAFRLVLLAALPIIGIYGLIQFIAPASWDMFWLENVITNGVTSMGRPEPFQIRVFGTMNSPGTFGWYIVCGLLAGLRIRSTFFWLATSPAVITLALTSSRSSWLALAAGVAFYLAYSPARLTASILTRVFVALLAITVLVSALHTDVGKSFSERAESFLNMKDDASFEERKAQVHMLIEGLDDNIFIGNGLGSGGGLNAQKLDNGASLPVIDGSIPEMLAMFGLAGTLSYLIGLCAFLYSSFSRSGDARINEHYRYALAVIVAGLVQIPLGSPNRNEFGVLFWAAIAFSTTMRMRGQDSPMRGES